MTFAVLNSNNQIGMELDALAPTLPPEDVTTMPRLRAIETVFTAAAIAAHTAAANPALTPLGQREEVAKVIKAAEEALKSHQAEADRLTTIAAETRTQALQPPPVERTTEVLMLEREIRDRLAPEDPLQINVRYLHAIGAGDWMTVNAIENGPAAFPLITQEHRERGAAMKLGRSPLKATLDSQELTARRHASVVATTRNELRRLAKQFGIVED